MKQYLKESGMSNKAKRAKKAAKMRQHNRTFHNNKRPRNYIPVECTREPTKSIDDLTDYEVEQIWAEAVHIYRTEGFNPEEAEREIEDMIKENPRMIELRDRINRIVEVKGQQQARRDAPAVRFAMS